MENRLRKYLMEDTPAGRYHDVRQMIIKRCGIHRNTFYVWLNAEETPNLELLKRKEINKIVAEVSGADYPQIFNEED